MIMITWEQARSLSSAAIAAEQERVRKEAYRLSMQHPDAPQDNKEDLDCVLLRTWWSGQTMPEHLESLLFWRARALAWLAVAVRRAREAGCDSQWAPADTSAALSGWVVTEYLNLRHR